LLVRLLRKLFHSDLPITFITAKPDDCDAPFAEDFDLLVAQGASVAECFLLSF
jgi:hypothetical protein